ncbi:MAG: hypothetical protein IJL92_05740 [Thermoguttaceae bacterium]|nr:hypothetical protein [Thermoguttaceae bacterium]
MADAQKKMLARLRALCPDQTPSEPRNVSITAKCATLFNTTSTYGWGVLALLAWTMFLVCGRGGSCAAVKEALGTWEPYGRATLVSVEETNHSLNKKRLLKLSFSGQKDDGSTFSGVSYTYVPSERGDEVEIERLVGTEDVLHVKGASISGGGPLRDVWIVFIPFAFLFFVGVFLGLASPMRIGLRALKFLTFGEYAVGIWREFRPPPKDRKGQFVGGVPAEIDFEFNSKTDGVVTASFKTMQPWLYSERSTAPLLYLSDEPSDENALFYYDLPSGICFDLNRGVCGRLPKVLFHFALISIALTGFAATFATTMDFTPATITPGRPGGAINATDETESTPTDVANPQDEISDLLADKTSPGDVGFTKVNAPSDAFRRWLKRRDRL